MWIKIKDFLISFAIILYVIVATMFLAIIKGIDYCVRLVYKLTFENYKRKKENDER